MNPKSNTKTKEVLEGPWTKPGTMEREEDVRRKAVCPVWGKMGLNAGQPHT